MSTDKLRDPHHPGSHLPGALGKGQAVATASGNFFKFLAYASTVVGAIVAVQYLDRFKTIALACGVYIVRLVILVATSTPAGIESGAGFEGLIAAMVVIGMGTGGSIKTNVTPMCVEQYRPELTYVKTLKSGERVVVDPELTVEHMFNWFVAYQSTKSLKGNSNHSSVGRVSDVGTTQNGDQEEFFHLHSAF